MTRVLVVEFPEGGELAPRIAEETGGELVTLSLHRFPDGEALIRYPRTPAGCDVVLVSSLDRPDSKFLPLVFAANTARDLGAKRVGLAAPYLAYMRQDAEFEPFQSVSAQHFAKLISQAFDWLVTVDPHLHRIAKLPDVYSIPCEAVHAADAIASWISKDVAHPVVIGPDSESAQWASEIAQRARAPYTVWTKKRSGDRAVAISPEGAAVVSGRTPVVIDDIIATGETMAEAVLDLKRLAAAPAICIGVHAVFAAGALKTLKAAAPARIVTTNTIAHETNGIDVSAPLSRAVAAMLARAP